MWKSLPRSSLPRSSVCNYCAIKPLRQCNDWLRCWHWAGSVTHSPRLILHIQMAFLFTRRHGELRDKGCAIRCMVEKKIHFNHSFWIWRNQSVYFKRSCGRCTILVPKVSTLSPQNPWINPIWPDTQELDIASYSGCIFWLHGGRAEKPRGEFQRDQLTFKHTGTCWWHIYLHTSHQSGVGQYLYEKHIP